MGNNRYMDYTFVLDSKKDAMSLSFYVTKFAR